MPSVQVGFARTVDRESLLRELEERGVEARSVDDGGRFGIEVPCDGDAERMCTELYAELESWIGPSGLPLVPMRVDGAVFLRPPLS